MTIKLFTKRELLGLYECLTFSLLLSRLLRVIEVSSSSPSFQTVCLTTVFLRKSWIVGIRNLHKVYCYMTGDESTGESVKSDPRVLG